MILIDLKKTGGHDAKVTSRLTVTISCPKMAWK